MKKIEFGAVILAAILGGAGEIASQYGEDIIDKLKEKRAAKRAAKEDTEEETETE